MELKQDKKMQMNKKLMVMVQMKMQLLRMQMRIKRLKITKMMKKMLNNKEK
jgi:hypothetical protein